jgi:Uma2 family endonuclease
MCAVEYYTYEEYCQWEGNWEMIYGVPLAMSPAPMIHHQAIAYEIAFELKSSSRECKQCLVFGEADWKINNDTVVKPDVVLICNETNKSYMTKAPEIIVEVISKSTAKRDEKTKFKLYEEEKVKYYVIVYPNDLKAKIYKLQEGHYSKEGDFLTESYTFEESSCKASVNFGSVFERFRG